MQTHTLTGLIFCNFMAKIRMVDRYEYLWSSLNSLYGDNGAGRWNTTQLSPARYWC